MWVIITVLTSKPQLSPRVPPLPRSHRSACLAPCATALPSLCWAGREGRARHLRAAAGPREPFLPCSLGHRLSGETHAHLIPAHLPSLSLGKLSDLPTAEFLRLQPALSPRSPTRPGPRVAGLHYTPALQSPHSVVCICHDPTHTHPQARVPLTASPVPPHRLMVFDHHMKLGALVQGDTLEVPLKALEEKEKRCLNLWTPRRDCVWSPQVPLGH